MLLPKGPVIYIDVGEATTRLWGDVDKMSDVMTLNFTARTSLIFSSPLAYVSLHPMPDKTVSLIPGGPRMIQVEYVEAHVGRNNEVQAAVTRIAQQANTVITNKYWGQSIN